MAGLIVLSTGVLLAETQLALRDAPECKTGAERADAIVALADRISQLWETGKATELAKLLFEGTLSTPNRPVLDQPTAIEAAILEALGRSIFRGSHLAITLLCLQAGPQDAGPFAVEGTWNISRLYGEQNPAGGNPMPRHLMPPTSGGFVAGVLELESGWAVTDLSLAFDVSR